MLSLIYSGSVCLFDGWAFVCEASLVETETYFQQQRVEDDGN